MGLKGPVRIQLSSLQNAINIVCKGSINLSLDCTLFLVEPGRHSSCLLKFQKALQVYRSVAEILRISSYLETFWSGVGCGGFASWRTRKFPHKNSRSFKTVVQCRVLLVCICTSSSWEQVSSLPGQTCPTTMAPLTDSFLPLLWIPMLWSLSLLPQDPVSQRRTPDYSLSSSFFDQSQGYINELQPFHLIPHQSNKFFFPSLFPTKPASPCSVRLHTASINEQGEVFRNGSSSSPEFAVNLILPWKISR